MLHTQKVRVFPELVCHVPFRRRCFFMRFPRSQEHFFEQSRHSRISLSFPFLRRRGHKNGTSARLCALRFGCKPFEMPFCVRYIFRNHWILFGEKHCLNKNPITSTNAECLYQRRYSHEDDCSALWKPFAIYRSPFTVMCNVLTLSIQVRTHCRIFIAHGK